jgi:hypothetical protein
MDGDLLGFEARDNGSGNNSIGFTMLNTYGTTGGERGGEGVIICNNCKGSRGIGRRIRNESRSVGCKGMEWSAMGKGGGLCGEGYDGVFSNVLSILRREEERGVGRNKMM